MEYAWDPAKAARNLRKHGVPFAAITGFDWDSALVIKDLRRDYGERRLLAQGLIGDRLHALAFTVRGQTVRIISLRKSNAKEIDAYRETQNRHRKS